MSKRSVLMRVDEDFKDLVDALASLEAEAQGLSRHQFGSAAVTRKLMKKYKSRGKKKSVFEL